MFKPRALLKARLDHGPYSAAVGCHLLPTRTQTSATLHATVHYCLHMGFHTFGARRWYVAGQACICAQHPCLSKLRMCRQHVKQAAWGKRCQPARSMGQCHSHLFGANIRSPAAPLTAPLDSTAAPHACCVSSMLLRVPLTPLPTATQLVVCLRTHTRCNSLCALHLVTVTARALPLHTAQLATLCMCMQSCSQAARPAPPCPATLGA